MKLIFEFARIAAFCFAGEVCHLVLPLPIPASVYGLMLLLAALRFGVVKLEQVRTAALFLTGIFPLLFVPAAAGVMDLWADLQAMLVPVLLALIPITNFGHDGVRLRDPAPGRAEGEKAMITQVLESSAVWGVLLTLAAFGLGVLINKRTGKAIFNPLLLGTAFVIVVLSVLNIPYDTYAASASPISYLLLPATVSLAVPLYEKWDLLCKNLVAIVAGVLAGVMASLFSVLALALLLDLNHEQYITLLPKSVTTAISMDVSRELGGIATLTGAIVILTGIVGALAAETVCKVFRITNPIAKGIGIGTASHAVGTSKALEIGEVEGAMSGLSVAVAGIMTAVLCPLFSELIH